MVDTIRLSTQEEAMLKQPDTLMDSTRRNRIIDKVQNCIVILDTVATFGKSKIDYDKLWIPYKINTFLRALVRHDSTKTPIDENTKLLIAGDLIKIGLEYYTAAFRNMRVHSKKVKEMNETITAINEVIEIERTEKKYSRLYAMRKGNKFPPDPKDFGMDHEYRARCDICWHWSRGDTDQEAIKSIRHHDYCNFKDTTLENCIRIFNPRKIK